VKCCAAKGYKVNKIGRAAGNGVDTYQWDIMAGKIDPDALNGVDTIIHLAGAGVADKRWTEARKREIYNSLDPVL
jgi:NAD dependent epimerase/dehydratase family enzyme